MPAENVSFPLENWPDGTVKTRLSAKKANFFFSEGIIWAEGVVVEQFTQSGDGNGALFAENCIVDRVSKSGWINGKAELCQGGSVVKGEGVYFSAEKNQVVITSRSEIRLTGIKLDKKSLKKEVSK